MGRGIARRAARGLDGGRSADSFFRTPHPPPARAQPEGVAPRGYGRTSPRPAPRTQLCGRPNAARSQAAAVGPGPDGPCLMILYVLRHGSAEDEPPPGGDDGARRLTARGREKVREAAAGMRALGLKFDAILASPLPRAAETAELVAAVNPG